jgi:hypothetical protein
MVFLESVNARKHESEETITLRNSPIQPSTYPLTLDRGEGHGGASTFSKPLRATKPSCPVLGT